MAQPGRWRYRITVPVTDCDVRHVAFAAALGKYRQGSATWYGSWAGALVLALVDATLAHRARGPATDRTYLRVRRAIARVRKRSMRRRLDRMVDCVMDADDRDRDQALLTQLSGYADALARTREFALAREVYELAIAHARELSLMDGVPDLYVHLGTCAYRAADTPSALRCYNAAFVAATQNGNPRAPLMVQLAQGRLHRREARFTVARLLLDDAMARAQELGAVSLVVSAAHERGRVALDQHGVSHRDENAIEALKYFRVALLTRDGPVSSRLLTDIGRGLSYLGHFDSAREACLVGCHVATRRTDRWRSQIALLAIAAAQNDGNLFDRYTAAIERLPMPASLRAAFWLVVGDGAAVLGLKDKAEIGYAQAAHFGARSGVTPKARAAVQGLAGRRVLPTVRRNPVPLEPTVVELTQVVDTLWRKSGEP